jgi:hypothetical protein
VLKNDAVVAALDQARLGRYDDLHVILSVFVRDTEQYKTDIVTESLLAITEKLESGEPSFLIAPQLGGILKYQRLRILEKEAKYTDALAPGGDEQLERFGYRDSLDPAEIVEKAERVKEEINFLRSMKISDPRQFKILMARHHGIVDAEYLAASGEHLSPEAVRALRARAKKTTTKALSEIRKASGR